MPAGRLRSPQASCGPPLVLLHCLNGGHDGQSCVWRAPRSSGAGVVLLVLLATPSPSAQPIGRGTQQPALSEVVVEEARLNENQGLSGDIDLTIANKSEYLLTAWRVAITCQYPDSRIREVFITRDGYPEAEGLVRAQGTLVPPRSRIPQRVSCSLLDEMAPISADVSIVAAISLDGPDFGDFAAIADITNARAAALAGGAR